MRVKQLIITIIIISNIGLFAQASLDSGLVAFYPFNGNANDESGNGNDGTVNGATLTTDRFENASSAYSFDGVDDFILIDYSDQFNFQDAVTICAWINFEVGGDANPRIVEYSNQNWVLFTRGTTSSRQIHFGINGETSFHTSTSINSGNWYFICAVKSATHRRIYIDGVLAAEEGHTQSINSSTDPINIGRTPVYDFRNEFKGVIDNVRIYNRDLTESEIDSLYYEGDLPVSVDTTIAHWTFDECQGDTAFDVSGNGYHGLITGAIWTTGISGCALSFDPETSYVALPSTETLGFSSEVTMELLVYPITQGDLIANKNSGTELNGDFQLTLQPDQGIDFDWYTSDNVHIGPISSISKLTVNKWSHVAIVLDDVEDSGKLYINGSQDIEFTFTPTIVGNTRTLYAGGRVYNGTPRFSLDGLIDEIRISNTALSPDEFLPFGEQAVDDHSDQLPLGFLLKQNYPNPFNPITTIRYNLPKQAYTTLTIYNLLGQKVRTLVNGTEEPGYKSITWNGTDDLGRPVSAGVYLYRISAGSLGQAGEFIQVRKLVLLK